MKKSIRESRLSEMCLATRCISGICSIFPLHSSKISANLNMHWQNPVFGIGLSEPHGVGRFTAAFLCAKSQFTIMLGWVGSRKTGRVVCPVDQPTQSDTMIGLMWSGLKTIHTEAIIMPKSHSTKPPKQRTLTNSVSPKSIFFLMNSNREIIADNLSYSTAYALSRKNKAIIKFDRMQVAS